MQLREKYGYTWQQYGPGDYQTRCPLHEDQQESLGSLTIRDDAQGIIFDCGVCEAEGIRPEDYWQQFCAQIGITSEQRGPSVYGYALGAFGDLEERPQWVVWRGEPDSKHPDTRRKVPYSPTSYYIDQAGVVRLRTAMTNQPQTWGTFEDAMCAWHELDYDGIGFVFTPDDPYVGIDLDNAIDPETWELRPWAQCIVDWLDSYTELSPSGTGVHILVKGTLPPGFNRRGDKATMGVEVYSAGRYFTMTSATLVLLR